MPTSPDFDILIVGGGMVGAGVAALIGVEPALASARVALLEERPPEFPPADDDIDVRVSALSRASERILDAVGAWPLIEAKHRSAYTNMRVWDAQSSPWGGAALHFDASSTSEPNLGHIVENRRVQWALLDCPAFRRQTTVLRTQLSALEFAPDRVTAVLNDGRRLSAQVVIGADGAQSASRQFAGLDVTGWSYDQHAFVTHVRTALPHQRTAWQRFLNTGPIAFLPLADGRSSIVWSTKPEQAAHLLACMPEEAAREIEIASANALGAIEVAGPRAAFPLKLAHARQYCRERFVLVGDAAHAVHPLAGQGVNLGFMDCAALVQVMGEAVTQAGRLDAIADRRVLRRYERWRKSENLLAMGLIDGLNRLFGTSSEMLGWMRRTGLAAVDRSDIAKRLLIERAMGVRGEIPRIAARSR